MQVTGQEGDEVDWSALMVEVVSDQWVKNKKDPRDEKSILGQILRPEEQNLRV